MHCTWCGTMLPPGATTCPSCGRTPQQQSFLYPTPPAQSPSRGQSSLGGMTIMLIVLALLVMASGIGLIYYTAVFHPAQLHAQATATAQTLQTMQAQDTALANTQATGTAQANAYATATAQAAATAQAVATVTTQQNIYNQSTHGNPVFNDPLNGNNVSNWEVGTAGTGESCQFTGAAFHIVEPNKHFYLPCFARSTNFSNFAFQVKITIVKGDEGGVVFRADEANSKFYTFGITRDGVFDLAVANGRGPLKSLLFGPNSAIYTNPNQPNLLTVIARGSTIYLYINKQYVDSVRDNSYSSGEIGVYASDAKNPADVAFNNAQVWTL